MVCVLPSDAKGEEIKSSKRHASSFIVCRTCVFLPRWGSYEKVPRVRGSVNRGKVFKKSSRRRSELIQRRHEDSLGEYVGPLCSWPSTTARPLLLTLLVDISLPRKIISAKDILPELFINKIYLDHCTSFESCWICSSWLPWAACCWWPASPCTRAATRIASWRWCVTRASYAWNAVRVRRLRSPRKNCSHTVGLCEVRTHTYTVSNVA